MRNRAASVDDLKLSSSFQSIREILLQEKYADRLEKPLAFWALPADRRLPLAFLGRSLKDLLNTPFAELTATPGVGHKKLCSLVALLTRATEDDTPAAPFGIEQLAEQDAAGSRTADGEFDPDSVSETMWTHWTATVSKHGLQDERLGRLAPTLDALPKVIWNTPLGKYLDYSLADIRNLRTHGEKRVRVVLQVFSIVHDLLGNVQPQSHLSVKILPKFVEPIESWLGQTVRRGRAPSVGELREQLILPLLNQVQVDIGETVAELAATRLGVTGNPDSVRRQAMELGVTRARVYQLLEQCGDAMAVRWPEGRSQLVALEIMLESQPGTTSELTSLRRVVELFYPLKLAVPIVGDRNGEAPRRAPAPQAPISNTPPVVSRAYA